MPVFSAYSGLSPFSQTLHDLHIMLCAFAVLTGCASLMVRKDGGEHKFFGLIYLPLSLLALVLASYLAWIENSMVLFCFNAFCAYLLLSGWRATHEEGAPDVIDLFIPGSLFLLAAAVTIWVMGSDDGLRSTYLLFFAANAFYLSWRDAQHLRERFYWGRHRIFFAGLPFGALRSSHWIGRHMAGMVGSLLANLSVLVLTLLPLSLHFLWPAGLMVAGAYIAWRERRKKLRLRQSMPAAFQMRKDRARAKQGEPVIRRAA